MKDGFLVELSDCSRKLRHVFLFTDLLLCAKMKKTSVGYVPPPTPHVYVWPGVSLSLEVLRGAGVRCMVYDA